MYLKEYPGYTIEYFFGNHIGSRFYAYRREANLEPGCVMVWTVNNLALGGCLEIIMEVVSDIQNADGDVVSSRDIYNQTKCICC